MKQKYDCILFRAELSYFLIIWKQQREKKISHHIVPNLFLSCSFKSIGSGFMLFSVFNSSLQVFLQNCL